MPCTQVKSGLRPNSLTDDALSAQSLSPVRQMEELGHSQPQPPPHHLLSPGEPGDPKGPGPPTPRSPVITPLPFLPPTKVWFSSRRPTWERLYPFLKGKPNGQGEAKTGRDILRRYQRDSSSRSEDELLVRGRSS